MWIWQPMPCGMQEFPILARALDNLKLIISPLVHSLLHTSFPQYSLCPIHALYYCRVTHVDQCVVLLSSHVIQPKLRHCQVKIICKGTSVAGSNILVLQDESWFRISYKQIQYINSSLHKRGVRCVSPRDYKDTKRKSLAWGALSWVTYPEWSF